MKTVNGLNPRPSLLVVDNLFWILMHPMGALLSKVQYRVERVLLMGEELFANVKLLCNKIELHAVKYFMEHYK